MNRRALLVLALTFVSGLVLGIVGANEVETVRARSDYEQALILSELRQQANVIHLVLNNETNRALDLAITRAQSDLLSLETVLERDNLTVSKAQLCDTIDYVNEKLTRYIEVEPQKAHNVKDSLLNLHRGCKDPK